MSKREQKKVRKLLETKRDELLSRVRGAMRERAQHETPESDLGDQATNTISREVLIELSSSERAMLKLIEQALDRLDAGAYGQCVNCQQPIQQKRLDAVPWARHCIACQELQDRGEL